MAEIDLCAEADVPEGGAIRVDAADRRFAVVRLPGGVHVIDDRCSHAEASLAEGEVFEDEFEIECPRHGATFDLLTGEARTLPATTAVAVYPSRVEAGRILVEVAK